MESSARRHAMGDCHIVIIVVVTNTNLIPHANAGWAGNGNRLHWVLVAEGTAPALVGLSFHEPTVDAPGSAGNRGKGLVSNERDGGSEAAAAKETGGSSSLGMILVPAAWQRSAHLPAEQGIHAERAFGIVSASEGCLGQRRERRAHAQFHLLAVGSTHGCGTRLARKIWPLLRSKIRLNLQAAETCCLESLLPASANVAPSDIDSH